MNINGKMTGNGSIADQGVCTLNVTGEFVAGTADEAYVDNLNVTGNGIVSGTATKVVKVTIKAIIGTAPTTSATLNNNTTVSIVLNGTSALAVVYGTPAVGKVTVTSNGTLASATLYTTTNILFGTIYTYNAVTSSPYATITVPEIVGTIFMGWYDNPSFIGSTVYINGVPTATNGVSYFMKLTGVTYSITFSAVQNGTWYVNGNVVSGTATVAYASSYDIQFLANNGYELKDVKILVNGSAMPLGYTPTTGDVLTISGSVEEKSVANSGLSVTDILLIVMVIIVGIIAVVVILKLMKS